MNTQKYILISAFLMGALAVIFGAFGAHVLKEQWQLAESSIKTYNIGVSYHFYHTFALLGTALLFSYLNDKYLRLGAIFFILGIILFSGSLYLLATRFALGIEHWKFLGPLTPIGGMFFILGWTTLLLGALKMKKHP